MNTSDISDRGTVVNYEMIIVIIIIIIIIRPPPPQIPRLYSHQRM